MVVPTPYLVCLADGMLGGVPLHFPYSVLNIHKEAACLSGTSVKARVMHSGDRCQRTDGVEDMLSPNGTSTFKKKAGPGGGGSDL